MPSTVSFDNHSLTAVTAVLRLYIEDALVHLPLPAFAGGDVSVVVRPPDTLDGGSLDNPRLNVFLYHVMPSNRIDKGLSQDQKSWEFEYWYLMAASATKDHQAEALIEYVLNLFGRSFTIGSRMIDRLVSAGGRDEITETVYRRTWSSLIVKPNFLSVEDTLKLWAGLQTQYRPSIAYRVYTSSLENDPNAAGA